MRDTVPARKTLESAVAALTGHIKSAEGAARHVAAQLPDMDANEARRFAAKARREAEVSSREARIALWIADFISDAERMSGEHPLTLRAAAAVLAATGNEAAAELMAMLSAQDDD